MKKSVLTRIAITLAFCMFGLVLFAQQPVISVIMSDSVPIPHSYDDVIMLPNGDLRFLDFTLSEGSIAVTDFRYLARSGMFTDVMELAVITGLDGLPQRSITADRFGRLYAVYQYPWIGTPTGLVVFSFADDDMEYRVIDELNLVAGFDAQHHADIVGENTLAVALANHMICYNLDDGSQSTILDGDSYPSSAGFKKTIAIPDGHFLLTYFSGYEDLTHTFVVFDSTGTQVATTALTDPRFDSFTCFDPSWSKDYTMVNDRFYLTIPGYDYDELILECHFPTADSLHCHIHPDASAFSVNSRPSYQFKEFGDGYLVRAYWGVNELYEDYSAIEFTDGIYGDDHQVIGQYVISPNKTHLNDVGNNLLAITARQLDQIDINILCPLDFPTNHSFSFSSPYDGELRYHHSKVFSRTGWLTFVSKQNIFGFNVHYSVPNDDEVATPAVNAFTVYPNPVYLNHMISIKHSLQEQVKLDIFNIRGQKVKALSFDADNSIKWDLRNDKGEKLPAGVYLAKARNRQDLKPFKFVIIP